MIRNTHSEGYAFIAKPLDTENPIALHATTHNQNQIPSVDTVMPMDTKKQNVVPEYTPKETATT